MKEGGGVAICIHDSLKYKRRKDLDKLYTDTFECVFIELTIKQKIHCNRIPISPTKHKTKKIHKSI